MICYFQEKLVLIIYSKIYYEKKRGFKYNLVAIITLKRWNNAINRYNIEVMHIKTKAITETN